MSEKMNNSASDLIFQSIDSVLESKTEWLSHSLLVMNNHENMPECVRFITMAVSYLKAASILYEHNLQGEIEKQVFNYMPVLDIDSIIIPFAYLCRQSIELSIKAGILYYYPDYDVKGKLSHNLEKAWNTYCKINSNDSIYSEIKEKISVNDIRKITNFDDGMTFRYPQNYNNPTTDAVAPFAYFNLAVNICLLFNKMCMPAFEDFLSTIED